VRVFAAVKIFFFRKHGLGPEISFERTGSGWKNFGVEPGEFCH
jgi:hypothetical protein